MSGEQGIILVAGATGTQGGSVVRHLRAGGFAVTRHHPRPRCREGAAAPRRRHRAGPGDLTDRASVDGLFGLTGVFSVATPFEAGLEAEVAQGKTLGDAAKAAGVSHYVYSSVGAAERDSKVPHFESKWAIENHLRALGLPLTVQSAPCTSTRTSAAGLLQPSGAGYTLAMPLSPDRPLQAIAAGDIGAFVAKAFADPGAWTGREFELAGDERTLPEYAAAISAARGVGVEYVQVPWEALRGRTRTSIACTTSSSAKATPRTSPRCASSTPSSSRSTIGWTRAVSPG